MKKLLHKILSLRIETSLGYGYFSKIIVSAFGVDIIGWKIARKGYGLEKDYEITKLL